MLDPTMISSVVTPMVGELIDQDYKLKTIKNWINKGIELGNKPNRADLSKFRSMSTI